MNTPLGDPNVTIDDGKTSESLTLKFSLLCQYTADRRGVDLEHLIEQMRTPGPGKLAMVLDLFAAMVSHNYVESSKSVPTAEQWALRIPEDAMPDISKAVIACLGKRLGLPQTPVEAPKQAQAPLQ